MAKVKVNRKSISLDMTAMCDVAFLLLTFFMLTTKFKEDDEAPIDTPSSISEIPLPDADVMLISLDKKGKVFFSVDRLGTRQEMLLEMGRRYNVKFTDNEVEAFRKTGIFGLPMANMKQYLGTEKNQRARIEQPGIPCDTLKNELKDWIVSARLANQRFTRELKLNEGRGVPLKIAIKGDQEANADGVKQIIATLQDMEINKFNFITDLDGLPDFLKDKSKRQL
ncbi:MAG: biopolymer transporter ExbD [Verrucomicrobia bacterium]|nr:biopolymer transporter ExbD [Cytophagales bacterium]